MSRDAQALKALGQNIKALRLAQRITQEELAELCDFDPTYISLLERGKRNPAFISLVKIAKSLRSNVSELREGV